MAWTNKLIHKLLTLSSLLRRPLRGFGRGGKVRSYNGKGQ